MPETPADWRAGGFGIYLHWPFCQAKCPYCDFNSHVSREIDHGAWTRAYLAEIDRYAELVPGRVVNSIYFGGGTPSLMPASLVEAILERIRHHWPFANDIEVTLEANPGSAEADRFRGYALAGVNRLSLGVQALNDTDLARLGRIHTVAEALTALDMAAATFDRVSFDLIYARQDQSLDEWERELDRALALAADHLSLYQLTVEDGTAFGDRYSRGLLRGLPSEDLSADLYDLTLDKARAAGFESYEVSNLARPGAESRHNQVYWRYGDYVGIGPGAHGRLTIDGVRIATEATRLPGPWLETATRGAETETVARLAPEDQGEEFLLMGLRLAEGISPSRFQSLTGHPLNADRVDALVADGLLSGSSDRLTATRRGRLVLNALLVELLRDE